MKLPGVGIVKRLLWFVLAALGGAFVVLLVVFVLYFNSHPDLSAWHTAELDEEFTAESGVTTFAGYLALEERLFAQLDKEVYDRGGPTEGNRFRRFHRGSRSDPGQWPRDWNRTYEMRADAPRAGVLLLHGLSDSPYSLHNVAERLHAAGALVVGLRLPGHGTAPSGLVDVKWEDWAAAVRIAMRHLREEVGERPIHIVGYSNGGALAVQYAITALGDTSLPRPRALVLISPEIGVTPAAALAIWQERLGRWLGLDKLKWSSVLPEYDPFKYQSFAVNAGNQAYRITTEIDERLGELHDRGALADFPPTLVFQSVVDATVQVPDLITQLMKRLPANGSELVAFDVNRIGDAQHFIRHDPRPALAALLGSGSLDFTLTLVTNASATSFDVEAQSRRARSKEAETRPLGIAWPHNLFSLSHVALPFPPDDALYGAEAPPGKLISIGRLVLHGEKGVLAIPASDMLRVRWNPFYPYLEERLVGFLGLE